MRTASSSLLCPPCTFSVPAQADQGIIKCAMGAIVQLSVRVVQRADKAKACAHGLSMDGYHLCPASPPGLASWPHPSRHHHHRSKQAGTGSARPFTLKIKRGPKKGALGFTAKFGSGAVVVESVLPADETEATMADTERALNGDDVLPRDIAVSYTLHDGESSRVALDTQGAWETLRDMAFAEATWISVTFRAPTTAARKVGGTIHSSLFGRVSAGMVLDRSTMDDAAVKSMCLLGPSKFDDKMQRLLRKVLREFSRHELKGGIDYSEFERAVVKILSKIPAGEAAEAAARAAQAAEAAAARATPVTCKAVATPKAAARSVVGAPMTGRQTVPGKRKVQQTGGGQTGGLGRKKPKKQKNSKQTVQATAFQEAIHGNSQSHRQAVTGAGFDRSLPPLPPPQSPS